LHSLYRAAVSASFSLVVLLITLCDVAVVLLFGQIKKEGRRKEDIVIDKILSSFCRHFSLWNTDVPFFVDKQNP